jgi:hypothetical protein
MRKIVLMLSLVVGAFTAAPAQAAGFLQDLFERFERPAPVMYRYAPPEPRLRFIQSEPTRLQRSQGLHRMSFDTHPRMRRKSGEARRISVRSLGPRTAMRSSQRVKVASLTQDSVKALMPPCCRPDVRSQDVIGIDKTLRVGDALMTSKGLRVYRGGASSEGAFIDYRKADLGQETKSRLGALERRTSGEARMNASAPRLAATKHVTVETAVRRTSLDPAGRVIRVVGP